ncbi:SDR family oxidoreductase [Streptomyces himalayensis]|uniref:SDR family oxidoreductase n=1 Tax=Streptomyces himalayensis subsp. himalayensis TaxID=2756131 RepID=A0A7W0DR23_9ACTN|nr:SDR family oxidoreductase [Streptomyces himalayensis]MBA2949660.1 SDR family oxidoreductase [Streptomyces himalayensis subsp. himalayensis]
MSKRILITGAGSGFGEGVAIGLAQAGHDVIATTQIYPQVTALRNKAAELGLDNLRVQKLDVLDPYDVEAALKFDIDVLFSNAGIGEAGPVSEIPVELLRRNFETNVFAPLSLAQKFARKWIDEGRPGKVVFTSSMGGLFTPAGFGPYVSTKHALEALAEALEGELRPFNIKIQTVNPGAYLTGFNETMTETAFRWLDDSRNFNKRADVQAGFDALIGVPEGRLDPQEMIDAMIEVASNDSGKFRNVVPKAVEDMLKESQAAAWTHTV